VPSEEACSTETVSSSSSRGHSTSNSADVAALEARYAALEEQLRSKQAELVRARDAIAEERKWRQLFETASDAYLITDVKGIVREANPAAVAMLNVHVEWLAGKPLALYVAQSSRRLFRRALCKLAHSAHHDSWELLLKPRQRPAIPVEVRVGAIHDGAAGPPNFHWLVRDVSVRNANEARLLQAERLSAIGQMVTGLTHESRNALQRSQACLSMLAAEVRDRPEALDLLARAKAAQQDLHHLYESVRQYAAPMQLERESCNLVVLAREVWNNVQQTHESPASLVETVPEHGTLTARIDRFAIGQVFRNIFENSLSACCNPLPEIYLDWLSSGDNSTASVSIRDNGPGFSAEAYLKLFEPFFTTKTRGTGLGMAIARRIVEAHHGTIEIGNRRPGAEVIITLPKDETRSQEGNHG